MTKEEFLSGAPFLVSAYSSNYFYKYVPSNIGGYITEHTETEDKGHHCNVSKVTNRHVKLYTCILDRPVTVSYSLSKLILKT